MRLSGCLWIFSSSLVSFFLVHQQGEQFKLQLKMYRISWFVICFQITTFSSICSIAPSVAVNTPVSSNLISCDFNDSLLKSELIWSRKLNMKISIYELFIIQCLWLRCQFTWFHLLSGLIKEIGSEIIVFIFMIATKKSFKILVIISIKCTFDRGTRIEVLSCIR